jgi:hypothetical protein
MFDDWKDSFHSVTDIRSVGVTGLDETSWGDLEAHFVAILNDGRRIGFSMFLNQQTVSLYGPAG